MIQISIENKGDCYTEQTAAIMLYGQKTRYGNVNHKIATVHEIESIDGRPTVLPGRLLTESDLALIHKQLISANASQGVTWLDQRLLAKGPDRMIWWSAPHKRPLFFKTSTYVKNTFDGSAVCPIPGLVWMAIQGRGLYVYAVTDLERPTQGSALFQAPFFNVWGRGLICVGNAEQPKEDNFWNPEAWEKFFFCSHFTHPNFLMKDRLVKGQDPVDFWKKMVQAPQQSFPMNQLVPMPLKVEDLLDPLIVDRLNKLPKPKGEF